MPSISSLGVESTVSPPSLAHKEVASTPSPQRDVVHFVCLINLILILKSL